MLTAAELQTMTFPARQSYIDGIVLEGVTVIGGKPKLGKSWFVLRAGITIASGGVAFGNPLRGVTAAPVLYLGLEDGPKRLQDRLAALEPGQWPDSLTVVDTWPRFDAGGIDLLAEVVDSDGFRVVVIDTLARVRTPRKGKDSYQEDSDAIGQIHDLTRERPGLAVVLVHHNRKDDTPDDYIDALSGTTGITGVVDHIAVLQRGRGEADAVLRFTSRDADEHDTAFGFDSGCWTELGTAAEHDLTRARKAVLDAVIDLREAGVTDIAAMVDRPKGNTLRLLRALEEEGLIYQDGARGPWKPSNLSNSDNSELSQLSELPGFLETRGGE